MRNFLPVFIGFRYIRAKKRNGFISFISFASVLGIALGITVLITVLSVMNGFDEQIKNRIFSTVPELSVMHPYGISDWRSLSKKISANRKVVALAPFVHSQGMLSFGGDVAGVYFVGILPEYENKVSMLDSKLISGSLELLKPGSFSAILGVDLASKLGVNIGEKVTLVVPESSSTPIGILPRFKQLNIVGIFKMGGGFGFDSSTVFINIEDSKKLLHLANRISGIRIKTNDLYSSPTVNKELTKIFSYPYYITDWTSEYGSLFKAIQMEKTMMFVILLFIIAIALFNLVSTLVMVVTDKSSDIAILRTLGATPGTIMSIFVVQGGLIGLAGTIFGIIGGVFFAINAPYFVELIEAFFNVHFISESIYYINSLPSKLMLSDVLRISFTALFMSFLATIYPAWRAAKVNPVEALKYE